MRQNSTYPQLLVAVQICSKYHDYKTINLCGSNCRWDFVMRKARSALIFPHSFPNTLVTYPGVLSPPTNNAPSGVLSRTYLEKAIIKFKYLQEPAFIL